MHSSLKQQLTTKGEQSTLTETESLNKTQSDSTALVLFYTGQISITGLDDSWSWIRWTSRIWVLSPSLFSSQWHSLNWWETCPVSNQRCFFSRAECVAGIDLSVRTIRVWPEGAMSRLQDCFDYSDWDLLKRAATQNHTDLNNDAWSVLDNFCMDEVTTVKNICTFPNRKPLMNKDVRCYAAAAFCVKLLNTLSPPPPPPPHWNWTGPQLHTDTVTYRYVERVNPPPPKLSCTVRGRPLQGLMMDQHTI